MYALIGSFLTVLFLDFIWLFTRFKYHARFFQNVQGTNLTVRWIPASLVYILIPFALYTFAIQPSMTRNEAAQKGALLGLCMYGLYDLTNYATLQRWTLEMTIVDIVWGVFVCTVASAVGFSVSTPQ